MLEIINSFKDLIPLHWYTFLHGVFIGSISTYFYFIKYKIPNSYLTTETSMSCPLVDCAYGGYKNEVKAIVQGKEIKNIKCPKFDYHSKTCMYDKTKCRLYGDGRY